MQKAQPDPGSYLVKPVPRLCPLIQRGIDRVAPFNERTPSDLAAQAVQLYALASASLDRHRT